MNSNDRAPLQFCLDNNAEFVSRRSMTAPACIYRGHNRSTIGVGTSVVDHSLRVRCDAMRTLTLPACMTWDFAARHGPALQLLASNHCPVLFFCSPHTRTAKVKCSSRVTW